VVSYSNLVKFGRDKENFVGVFTLLVKGASCLSNREELFALNIPPHPVPHFARGIDHEKHEEITERCG